MELSCFVLKVGDQLVIEAIDWWPTVQFSHLWKIRTFFLGFYIRNSLPHQAFIYGACYIKKGHGRPLWQGWGGPPQPLIWHSTSTLIWNFKLHITRAFQRSLFVQQNSSYMSRGEWNVFLIYMLSHFLCSKLTMVQINACFLERDIKICTFTFP